MKNPIGNYWKIKLKKLKKRLTDNNFDAYIADTAQEVSEIVFNDIIPAIKPLTVSWGGSVSFVDCGLYKTMKESDTFSVLDTYDKQLSSENMLERRRQSLLSDLYITGANAVTECGKLVNLDMIGNRIAALAFGPKNVIVIVGRNKIVADVDAAMARIKKYAAPVNTMRLDKKTPCIKNSACQDCNSPDRICNTWTITEKSFPVKRVKVILINGDFGF